MQAGTLSMQHNRQPYPTTLLSILSHFPNPLNTSSTDLRGRQRHELLSTMQCSQPGSNASLPPLTFLHISDPSEAKLPSHRKAVHSHAALFQASQDRAGREPHAKRKEPRKRKRKNDWSGEPLILELGLYQNSQLERPGLIFPAEFWSQEAYQCFSPRVPLLGAGRVDPFRTYPIPWAPDIPQLVDHCRYLCCSLRAETHQLIASFTRYCQHGYPFACARRAREAWASPNKMVSNGYD
jgi:hypothetical protein